MVRHLSLICGPHDVLTDKNFYTMIIANPQLRTLTVKNGTHLSDAALAHLASACPGIQHVAITGSQATAEGVRKLQAARPSCTARLHDHVLRLINSYDDSEGH